jgi:hypothetical protein
MLTVLTQKPLFSTGKPSDAHDLRHVQPRALGRKASDEFAVPPCRSHHCAVHRACDERDGGTSPHANSESTRERTIRSIDSDILSTMDGKTPE